MIKQVKELKTFDKLPYYPFELLQVANVKVPEVEAFEKKAEAKKKNVAIMNSRRLKFHKSNIFLMQANNQPIAAFIFSSLPAKMERLMRSSVVCRLEPSCSRTPTSVYGNMEKNGLLQMNLRKSLAKKRFSFLRTTNNTHFFGRQRDHLLIAVTCVVDNNVPVLALLYNYDNTVFGAGSKVVKAQDKMISNFNKAKKMLKF